MTYCRPYPLAAQPLMSPDQSQHQSCWVENETQWNTCWWRRNIDKNQSLNMFDNTDTPSLARKPAMQASDQLMIGYVSQLKCCHIVVDSARWVKEFIFDPGFNDLSAERVFLHLGWNWNGLANTSIAITGMSHKLVAKATVSTYLKTRLLIWLFNTCWWCCGTSTSSPENPAASLRGLTPEFQRTGWQLCAWDPGMGGAGFWVHAAFTMINPWADESLTCSWPGLNLRKPRKREAPRRAHHTRLRTWPIHWHTSSNLTT